MDTLLTPKQVAARLNVSPRTVYAWIAEGRLPHVRFSERVTRVPEEAVEALVAANARPATRGLLAAEEHAAYGGAAIATTPDAPPDTRTPSERVWALLRGHRAEILEAAERCRVENVRVFGSVARGDARKDSDVDILVDPKPHASLLDLSEFNVEMERIIGGKVDVVMARSVKPLIRDRVMSEAVPL